jgi:hypothetical protein
MRVVKEKRVKKKASTFFAILGSQIVSLLFLGGLAYAFILVSDPIYKVDVLLVFLISFSYLLSAQMKMLDRLRPKTKPFLSVTQLVPAIKKTSGEHEDKERAHFKLIKEDTTTYLRAITRKNLKKDEQ